MTKHIRYTGIGSRETPYDNNIPVFNLGAGDHVQGELDAFIMGMLDKM